MTSVVISRSSGMVIEKNIRTPEAPSTRAASYSSLGIRWIATMNRTAV